MSTDSSNSQIRRVGEKAFKAGQFVRDAAESVTNKVINAGKELKAGYDKSKADQEQQVKANEVNAALEQNANYRALLAKDANFKPEDILNSSKIEVLHQRLEALNKSEPLKENLRVIYAEALMQEIGSKGYGEQVIDTNQALSPELRAVIEQEIENEILTNPERITVLQQQAETYKKLKKEIAEAEARLDKLEGSSKELTGIREQVQLVRTIDKGRLKDRAKLSLEERNAVDTVEAYYGNKESIQDIVTVLRKEARSLKQNSSKAESQEAQLAALQEKISEAQKTLFENTKMGEVLVREAGNRLYAKFSTIVRAADRGDLGAAVQALTMYENIIDKQGLTGETYSLGGQEEYDKLLGLVEKNFGEAVEKAIQLLPPNVEFTALEQALDKYATAPRIGSNIGFTETREFLQDIFTKAYANTVSNEKKLSLLVYLKKHNLHGLIKPNN